MALRRWGCAGGSSARPPAHRCKVDARDARRLAGAVDRQVPDARRHAVRQADRGLFLGAAAVREAGFQRAPLDLEIDIAHREAFVMRSEEHTSELQSLMRISYAVFCLKKKKKNNTRQQH